MDVLDWELPVNNSEDIPKPARQCIEMEIPRFNFKSQDGNVLFNDALNTFYLRLYGVRLRHRAKLCIYLLIN